MPKKHVFLFNGPPGSGKDFITHKVVKSFWFRGVALKFAAPIKRGAQAFYGLSDKEFQALDTFEKKKLPAEEFFGLTPRQPQIALSEVYAKPTHGKEIFGRMALREMLKHKFKTVFCFSDCGFPVEVNFLIQACAELDYEVTLIRIHRDGYTYEGDSRGYVYVDPAGPYCPSFDVVNDGTEDFVRNVKALIHERIGRT